MAAVRAGDELVGVRSPLARPRRRSRVPDQGRALAIAKPGRRLDTNVEFYTAILLGALKIPREAFTPVFAVGRTAGWVAHALEQQRTGRLLRPASVYTGRMPD